MVNPSSSAHKDISVTFLFSHIKSHIFALVKSPVKSSAIAGARSAVFPLKGQVVHQGDNLRMPRVDLTVATRPGRRHEEYALALVEPLLPEDLWDDHQVQHFHVRRSFPHSTVVFKFGSTMIRDLLVYPYPFVYDSIRQVRFVRHDQGPNWCSVPFARTGWFLLLYFPLDYINMQYICLVASTFGELDYWWEQDPIEGIVMIRAMFKDFDFVPRKEGEFADMFPPDEDLPPARPNNENDHDKEGGLDEDHIWQFGPNHPVVHAEDDQGWNQDTHAQNQNDVMDLEQAKAAKIGQVDHNDGWNLVLSPQDKSLVINLPNSSTQALQNWCSYQPTKGSADMIFMYAQWVNTFC
uniref:DUF7597 domain-containing protein n=1 Tax=Oryza punctata TaxID=4537 RepID=A0A0E0KZV6_ORYPU